MSNPPPIHLDISFFLLALAAIFLFFAVLSLFAFKQSGDEKKKTHKGWFVPEVGTDLFEKSIVHRWDVRIKIVSLFSYCLLLSMINKPIMALVALVISLCTVLLAKIPLSRMLRRMTAMTGFLAMFVIILPFTTIPKAGDFLIYFDPFALAFNLRGMQIALVIVFKAAAIAMVMEPLFNTAPLPVTVLGLQRLGVPSILCQMALMAHRYIFVFLHETKRMHTSMRLRGFRKRTDIETLKVLGNFVGMLMIRSVDRTERVYQAMLARGYNGIFPSSHTFKIKPLDCLLGLAWPAIAFFLLILDRYGVS